MIEVHLNLRYPHSAQGGEPFLLDVDLELPEKGVTAIFGPSGSGKTSLLRCIAGLERPANGSITVNGVRWQGDGHWLAAHQRNLGYVFQQAQLFSHLSVRENLLYGLRRKNNRTAFRSPRPAEYELDAELLQRLGVGELLNRQPLTLSGGEQQRVAIARALTTRPGLLLMDEPLASLDAARKSEVLPYIETLSEELEIPILYVSHSVEEMLRLADHVVMLNKGRVTGNGATLDVLNDMRIADALGGIEGVVMDVKVTSYAAQWSIATAEFHGGVLQLPGTELPFGSRVRTRILARDVSIALSPATDSSVLNILPAVVERIDTMAGAGSGLVQLRLGNDLDKSPLLLSSITQKSIDQLQLQVGMNVWAQLKSVAIVR